MKFRLLIKLKEEQVEKIFGGTHPQSENYERVDMNTSHSSVQPCVSQVYWVPELTLNKKKGHPITLTVNKRSSRAVKVSLKETILPPVDMLLAPSHLLTARETLSNRCGLQMIALLEEN